MTQDLENPVRKDPEDGLNWARIAGMTVAMAFHVAALLLLLAPMAPPASDQPDEQTTV
ncbi:MAG: hypothetical protein H0T88_02790, partial [Lysobacter sp.]|nr:hypothetical protein [Lysobacter sp.]